MLHLSNRILPYSMSLQFWEEKKLSRLKKTFDTRRNTFLFFKLKTKQKKLSFYYITTTKWQLFRYRKLLNLVSLLIFIFTISVSWKFSHDIIIMFLQEDWEKT